MILFLTWFCYFNLLFSTHWVLIYLCWLTIQLVALSPPDPNNPSLSIFVLGVEGSNGTNSLLTLGTTTAITKKILVYLQNHECRGPWTISLNILVVKLSHQRDTETNKSIAYRNLGKFLQYKISLGSSSPFGNFPPHGRSFPLKILLEEILPSPRKMSVCTAIKKKYFT